LVWIRIRSVPYPYPATYWNPDPDQDSAKHLNPDPDSVNTDSKHWVKEILSRGIRKFLMTCAVIIKMFLPDQMEYLLSLRMQNLLTIIVKTTP
jgi:hypothetical protein